MTSSPETKERRLHPVGMLLAALGTARRWIGLSAFPGIAALVNGEFGMRTLLLVLLAAVVLVSLSAAWGVLSWRATTYRVSGGAFHFKSGVLQKSERTLPLERIQGVSTVQGVVQRLFGVVEARVESAGSGGEPEVSLPALSRGAARELREELALVGSRRDDSVEVSEGPVVLRRLSVRELLLAGLTSGQIGVAVSVVAGATQVIDDVLPTDLARRASEALLPRTLVAVLLLALTLALFAWALSILGTVLAHANFTLSRSADGEYLYIKRGLLERYETTVPLARIQAVRVVEGVLRQPLGYATLRVESAGFGAERGVSTTLFPLLPRSEVRALLGDAAPRLDAPLEGLEPLPARARGRYATRTVLPAVPVVALVVALALPSLWGLLAPLILLPAALWGLLRHRAGGYGLADGRLVLRYRRLARTTVIAPGGRLQSRGYSVSPLQRRRRLATLEVEVASGSGGAAFRLPDVDAREAAGLIEGLSWWLGRGEVRGAWSS